MEFVWRTESDVPAPARLSAVDDRLTADEAVRRTRRGEFLLYEGDFHNAQQLLAAMGRRLTGGGKTFAAQRKARALEQDTLGRIVVALDGKYALQLRRAPDVAQACREVWGPPPPRTVVALKQLLGMRGASELRRKGLEVPGLEGRLTPHWGVWVPTRAEYLSLLEHLDVRGKHVLDLGTGTGVIGFMLLQRGAARVTAVDSDERAVACAAENAERLGLAEKFSVSQREGYPDGRFDVIICNPPWLPEAPKTRIDRAVFDEGSAFLLSVLDGVRDHGGELALLISDLAVLLGLREPGWLEARFAERGLTLVAKHEAKPGHGRAYDKADPLYAARSKERTTLYRLVTNVTALSEPAR